MQESRGLLEGLLDHSPSIIAIRDLAGWFLLINRAYEQIFDITKAEVIGKTLADIMPGDFATPLSEYDRQVIESGKPVIHEHPPSLKRSGDTLLSVRFPIRDDTGTITAIGSIATDTTESKRVEEQLRQSQKMAALGQLTGGIAHDFNNLLGVMIGNSELLEKSIRKNGKAQRQLRAIQRAVDLASSLTSHLLAFSRQQPLSPKITNLTNLIDGLMELLRRALGETIVLTVAGTPELWLSRIDPNQFENALVNLALNARDAMPEGGTLTIETANATLDDTYAKQHQEVTPGDYVEVAVSDTGTGMPPEVLKKVFEPFFTTKGLGEGSGLGLSMVHGFTKQSKGHITIYSVEGHGTMVKLYMPRSKGDVAQDDARDETIGFASGSERILIVEDDENFREVAASILRDQGYEVIEAGNGKEALKHLKDGQSFDLLFKDLVLPGGMSGIEIAQEAKKLQAKIKVLYTTGYAENPIFKSEQLGAAVVLKKPYRVAELLARVRATLDHDDA